MSEDSMLKEVKLYLDIGTDDTLQDELLKLIISETQQRILSFINRKRKNKLEEVPESESYILRDVTIKRYNKRNSEGAKADGEEGRSYTWEDSYLSEYEDILRSNWDKTNRSIARFI